uniref:14-3-3 domain-containing protein n=1 Tax=Ciona savignyi TaxID=51511 RepID=H2ZQW7_CIOSA
MKIWLESMKNAINLNTQLSSDERNLFSVAYKNVIGSRRTSWRIICNIIKKELEKGISAELSAAYRKKIENELETYCKEVLKLLDEKIIPTVENDTEVQAEAAVFYWKMKADYYRYMAEFMEDTTIIKSSLDAYKEAYKIAVAQLVSTNPIRLGLALNFSVFYYEINKNKEEACDLAKSAFDSAVAELDSISEDSYKDSTLIMQLLRDNLTLWTVDQTDINQDEDENDQTDDT